VRGSNQDMNDSKPSSSSAAVVIVIALFVLSVPCLAGVVLLFWSSAQTPVMMPGQHGQPSLVIERESPPVPTARPGPAPTP